MQQAAQAIGLPRTSTGANRFPAFAWSVLAYNLLVILWGALVRATSSGAGCGGHWPLCNGEVLPQALETATRIEFTHRVMSGVALGSVVALFVWARKAYEPGHTARRWAGWALVFMVTEALLGAALVLFGFVAKDQSIGRIVSLSLHLVNTFALLAAMALTAWWSNRAAPSSRVNSPQVTIGLVSVVLVAVAGAITALGDTLFPAASLAAGIAADFSAEASFLVRLRVIHPALAVVSALYLVFMAFPEFRARRSGSLKNLSAAVLGLVALQLVAGVVNLALRAPLAMQLIHLLIADLLWIALVLFGSEKQRA